jgi:hypothetical protein
MLFGSCNNLHFGGKPVLKIATQPNIPEYGIFHSDRRENLKAYIALTSLAL